MGSPSRLVFCSSSVIYYRLKLSSRRPNWLLSGLLDPEQHPSLHSQGPDITWRQLVCTLLGLEDSNIFYDNLTNKISERTGSDYAVDVLEELGLLDDRTVVKCGSPLDTITQYLSLKLALGETHCVGRILSVSLLILGVLLQRKTKETWWFSDTISASIGRTIERKWKAWILWCMETLMGIRLWPKRWGIQQQLQRRWF